MFVRLVHLSLRDLSERLLRSVLTVIGISIAVATYVTVEITVRSFERALLDNIAASGVQLEVLEKGAINFLASLIPETVVGQIAEVPGIRFAAPMLIRLAPVMGGRSVPLVAWSDNSFLWNTLKIVEGRRPARNRPYEAAVGVNLARDPLFAIGNQVSVQGVNVAIVGVVDTSDQIRRASLFFRLADLQEISYRTGQITAVGVAVDTAYLEKIEELRQLIADRIPDYEVLSTASILNETFAIILMRSLTRALSIIALCLVCFGVLNTVWTALRERRQEYAIMKAIGWPTRRIALFMVGQTCAIAIAGTGIGILVGYIGALFLSRFALISSYLEVRFEIATLLWAAGACVTASAIGVIFPLWTITRTDPAAVLRSP